MKLINTATSITRSYADLLARSLRALTSRGIDALLSAVLLTIYSLFRKLCLVAAAACLVAGFWKPHCFALAALLWLVSGLFSDTVNDMEDSVQEEM